MNNIGRPKKEGFDNTIKVTVNDTTASLLEETVKITGKSKSELLREIIPIVSSKDFEGLIPSTSLEILEEYSIKSWNILHTEGCIFETDTLSERMPAFVTTFGKPMVNVKYPTYKIQIFNGGDPHKPTDQKKIQDLLKTISNISTVYFTKEDYLIIGDKISKLEYPYINEVMCLDIQLKDCMESKNKIVNILKTNDYNYSVYPAYCIRADYIELLEEERYFKVLRNIEAQ